MQSTAKPRSWVTSKKRQAPVLSWQYPLDARKCRCSLPDGAGSRWPKNQEPREQNEPEPAAGNEAASDNLKTLCESSVCLKGNDQPERQRSCIQTRQCLAAPEKGAGLALFVCAPWSASLEQCRGSALSFFREPSNERS
jgi:hypothetical protein